MSTPLIITAVVVAIVALIVLAGRSNTKHAKSVERFASTQGWGYSRIDTQGLSGRVEELFVEEKFTLTNIMTVESGVRNVFLFDCVYSYRNSGRPGNFGTACLILSDPFKRVGTGVEIIARTRADVLLLSDQVDMGNTEFARHFIVQAKDAAAAHRIVNAKMQDMLLEHTKSPLFNPVRIGLGPSGAVLLTGYHAEHERWHDLVKLAYQVESTLE